MTGLLTAIGSEVLTLALGLVALAVVLGVFLGLTWLVMEAYHRPKVSNAVGVVVALIYAWVMGHVVYTALTMPK